MILHPLEPPNRLTENDSGAGVFIGHLENLLARADFIGAENWQRLEERTFHGSPVADEVVGSNRHIVEADFRGTDHETRSRFDRNAAGIFVNQREHDSAGLGSSGANETRRGGAIVDKA